MKTTISLFLASILSIVVLAGCKSSTDSSTSSSSGVTATIAGSPWSANASAAAIYTSQMQMTSIAAAGMDKQTISIGFNQGVSQTGTYDVMGGKIVVGYTNNGASYVADSGSVVVTSWTSSHITGTFNFTAMGTMGASTVKITNGKFDLDIKQM